MQSKYQNYAIDILKVKSSVNVYSNIIPRLNNDMISFQGHIVAQGAFKDIIKMDHEITLQDSASPSKTEKEKAVEEENRTVM